MNLYVVGGQTLKIFTTLVKAEIEVLNGLRSYNRTCAFMHQIEVIEPDKNYRRTIIRYSGDVYVAGNLKRIQILRSNSEIDDDFDLMLDETSLLWYAKDDVDLVVKQIVELQTTDTIYFNKKESLMNLIPKYKEDEIQTTPMNFQLPFNFWCWFSKSESYFKPKEGV